MDYIRSDEEEVEDLTGASDLRDDGQGPFQFEDLDHNDNRTFEVDDAWTVISAHFHERGLVGQQLDSFDNFMTSTMQVCTFVPDIFPFSTIFNTRAIFTQMLTV